MDILKVPPQVIPYMSTIPGIYRHLLCRETGVYYGALGAGGANVSLSVVANKLYSIPFLVLAEETFNEIAVYVETLGAGNGRLGIYSSSVTTGKPDALILDAGTIDTGTTGTKAVAITQTLSPGLYWLVAVYSGTPKIVNSQYCVNLLGFGASSFSGAPGSSMSFYSDFNYAELPAAHPALTPATGSSLHGIVLKRA